MNLSNNELQGVIPVYVSTITKASDPVFRTCEVLVQIDNLFAPRLSSSLDLKEKIVLLKKLRKGLEQNLSRSYLINDKQDDPSRSILKMIDSKIDEYMGTYRTEPKFAKVYKRPKSWWR